MEQVLLSWAGWQCLDLGQQKFDMIFSIGQTQQESTGFGHTIELQLFLCKLVPGKRMECPYGGEVIDFTRCYQGTWQMGLCLALDHCLVSAEDLCGQAGSEAGGCGFCGTDTQTAAPVSVLVLASTVVCFAAHKIPFACKIYVLFGLFVVVCSVIQNIHPGPL